jgi:hypothetical protein
MVVDQEGALVDVNNAEVALLLIEREKAMIPVNTKAFSMSQQSGQRLNSLYTGALVVYRDGSVDAIDRIELQGFYGSSIPKKLQSAALGAHYIKTCFRKHPLSLEQFKELVTLYLPSDTERGAPYLPLSQPLNAVLEAVRAGTSFERVFDALHLPDLEDCLDVL